MEAIAKHDFNATAEDELSFRKGQVLKVSFYLLFSLVQLNFFPHISRYSTWRMTSTGTGQNWMEERVSSPATT